MLRRKSLFSIVGIGFLILFSSCIFKPMVIADESFIPEADIPEGLKLVEIFSDDFNSTELDSEKWIVAENPRRNNYWHPDAVKLEDGKLVIETKLATITHTGDTEFTTWHDEQVHQPGAEVTCYISGSVNSKQRFVKGFFTAKLKMKKEVGHWNAFWLYCNESADIIDHNDDGEIDGQDGAEIDMMECADAGTIYHVIHWNSSDEKLHGKAYKINQLKGYEDGWFLISLLWTNEEYIFYINGKEAWRTAAGNTSIIPSELIFSDEINNDVSWSGDIREAQNLPDRYEIDFVKVYKLETE